jgi:hypothetical protein
MTALVCAVCDKDITNCCLNLWCKKHKKIQIETCDGEPVFICESCLNAYVEEKNQHSKGILEIIKERMNNK